ncbi:MAG: hypothetical protein JW958_10585 [Candidatus Eisenbacteria bacterium]|nr:hypothetical protein [Candidatus Eisenbacteria bacterium]
MRSATLVLAALLLAGTTAPRASSFPFVGIGARYGTLAMDDVNDRIRDIDESVEGSFDEIIHGRGLSAELGMVTSPGTAIVFRWERIFARTKAADAAGSIAFDMGAHAITGSLEIRRSPDGRALFGAGLGGGFVYSAGEADLNGLGIQGISGETRGAGPVAHFYVYGEFPLTGGIFLVPSAWYRYARVNRLEIGGRDALAVDGTALSVDYGGVSIAASLRYYFAD